MTTLLPRALLVSCAKATCRLGAAGCLPSLLAHSAAAAAATPSLAQLLRNPHHSFAGDNKTPPNCCGIPLHSLIPFAGNNEVLRAAHAKPNKVARTTRTVQKDRQLGLGCLESQSSNSDVVTGISDYHGGTVSRGDGERRARYEGEWCASS